jgi:hypothetical protein
MYTWACGATSTAANNMGLIIPKIRWLGAHGTDLLNRGSPPSQDMIERLLQKLWVQQNRDIHPYINELAKGTGGIEDMACELDLGNLILRKITEKKYIRVVRRVIDK